MIGQKLRHYVILEKIGAGGMGEVYRARDERLERDVAIKVLPAGALADEAARKLFRQEALALAKVNHPNIGAIYEFDTQDGMDFLVMEYIPGVTLAEKLAQGPLPEKEVVGLAAQLAEGLAAAHEQGLVHRDLKPGNLRLLPDGRLKIIDFGLAKLLRPGGGAAPTESFADTQATAGTLPYMAPEQLRNEKVDARADIWAAGTVLYEMTTGQRPFPETRAPQLIASILQGKPPVPSQVNRRIAARLERMILKCLEKNPSRRYPSARAFQMDLGRLAASPQPSAPRQRRAAPRRIQSLAVLPLENLSRDPGQEYFVDGMTEALITDLAKIGALRVISRTSAMRYKDSGKPLPEIGRELGVDAIVEGSVLRAGDQVRITAQLIHASSDSHLWAESYARDFKDVLSLQSEVAQAIAREVKARVTPEEEARLLTRRTVNPAAHEAYLLGRYFWNQRGPGLKKSIEFFERALAEDPNYAPAHAGLADAYALLGFYGYFPPREVMPKAEEAARKALELDPNRAEAHASLGFVYTTFEWEWAAAEKEFHRALKLNPSWGPARYWYATLLLLRGRFEEAIAQVRTGLQYDPLSMYLHAHLGIVFWYAGRHVEASEQFRKALELDPKFFVARAFLGATYYFLSRLEDSLRELRCAVESSDRHHWPLAQLGAVYAASGDRTRAQEVITELEHRCRQEYISAMGIAVIYAQLREEEKAFEWLEKAYLERSSLLWSVERYPLGAFDNLRSDPRSEKLLRRIGLRDDD